MTRSLHPRVPHPSPAMLIACLALLVALGGTALAAAPIVKRALYADNAGKLAGKTLAQVAGVPGPASSVGGLVSVRTASATLAGQEEKELTIRCAGGERVVAGGWTAAAPVLAANSHPSADDTWSFQVVNLVSTATAVTLSATCVR